MERYDYARRNGLVERVAHSQNIPKRPFTDAKLAAWVGKTVEEMDAMAVTPTAANIVYDALAQSKSSLIPEKVVTQRRASFINAAGGVDEGAFMSGMVKSRIAVVTGFFLLGKGQLYGYVLAGKIVLDSTGTTEKLREFFGPYTDPIFLVLTLGAVVYAYQQSVAVQKATGNFETLSYEEAKEKQKFMDNSATVFDKLAGGGK